VTRQNRTKFWKKLNEEIGGITGAVVSWMLLGKLRHVAEYSSSAVFDQNYEEKYSESRSAAPVA
jgi:hypothetical protein